MQQADLDNLRAILGQWCEDCDSSEAGRDLVDSLFAKVEAVTGAAPAMLAALQKVAGCAMAAPELSRAGAWDVVQAAIALATGTPTGEQAPPLSAYAGTVSDAEYREIANGRQPWPLAAPTGEAGGGKRAATDFSQDDMGREYTCTACGREESECSAEPCEAVIEDRES